MTVNRDSVVIVGGGPAGCLAAIELARAGVAVKLIDRSRRSNMIAETLSPEGRRALARAGLWHKLPDGIALRCDAIGTAWERSALVLRSFVRNPYGAAWHLDRLRFDEWLRSEAVAAGVERVIASARDLSRHERGWDVSLDDGSICSGSFLVIATGRTSSFATKLASRSRLDSRCVIGGFGTASSDATLVIEAISTGWWYSMPLSDGRLFAGWVTDATLTNSRMGAQFDAALAESVHTRARVHDLRPTLARAASSSMLSGCAGDRWIAIGDASLARDPLTGDGIAAALRSGHDAVSAVIAALNGDSSGVGDIRARVEQETRTYVHQRVSAYRSQRRWEGLPFWRDATSAHSL